MSFIQAVKRTVMKKSIGGEKSFGSRVAEAKEPEHKILVIPSAHFQELLKDEKLSMPRTQPSDSNPSYYQLLIVECDEIEKPMLVGDESLPTAETFI